jgi:hypothetical protein
MTLSRGLVLGAIPANTRPRERGLLAKTMRTLTTMLRDVPVHIRSGEREITVRAVMLAHRQGDWRLTASLRDRYGTTVASVDMQRVLMPQEVVVWRQYFRQAPPATIASDPQSVPADNANAYAFELRQCIVPDGRADVPVEYDVAVDPHAPEPLAGPGVTVALRLHYKMGQGERFLRIEIPTAGSMPLPGKPRMFGQWIYSDGNNNYPRMRYRDSTGQQFQTDGPRMTWRGWRYMSFSLDPANATHTGGANDGAAHYPIRIEAPLVMWNGYGRAVEGTIWIACPAVLY